MAQALYDEHPLDEYLKESGERLERVPGAFTDILDEEPEDTACVSCIDLTLSPSSLVYIFEALRRWSSTVQSNIFPSLSDDFAERFKYDLISSSLLSSSVSTSPIAPHPRSRISSPDRHLPGELKTSQPDAVEKTDQLKLSSAFVFVGLAALMNQRCIAALLALLSSFSFAKSTSAASVKQNYIPLVFESLENLRAAGSAWDAAVNDAITIIEGEERSVYYSPCSPSPSSALRVSLHSTLLTTQHQCDNVRPLLAALASPTELSQLSEMYAPQSPVKPSFSLQPKSSTPSRKRLSLSENVFLVSSSSRTPLSEKRQTWNGSHVSGINAHKSSVLRKYDRRPSEMATILASQHTTRRASTSTPPRSPILTQVTEVDEEEEEQDSLIDIPVDECDLSQDKFGTAALFLRRKRRASGIQALGLSASRSVSSIRDSTHLTPPSSLSSSRFTSLTTTRNPLSLSALHLALHGALASRRYACAHLLALRFKEDAEDESYWENVRSVTTLLTSTLEDAAARLGEALSEADKLSKQEGQPTPESSPETSSNELLDSTSSPADVIEGHRSLSLPFKLSRSLDLQIPPSPSDGRSFAPMPSGIVRFASHVDSISTSINEAKRHLVECVEDLKEGKRSAETSSSSQELADAAVAEQAVLQTYDQLRRELGHALRECERGRAALLDVFEARRRRTQHIKDSVEVEEEEGNRAPPFGHVRRHTTSGSSGESYDKADLGPLTPPEGSPVVPTRPSLDSVISARLQESIRPPLERDMDDVTQHLLLTASSLHLPPPGIEQVFESESAAVAAFKRERSKLSREERIKLMKSKRDSMVGRGLAAQLEDDDDNRPVQRGWGPGTDVVEELKDVIWKVGERRRKMMRVVSSDSAPRPSVSIPGPSGGSGEYDTSLCTS